MAKRTYAQSTKSCSDCVHEYACRMWTDGRMISDESASLAELKKKYTEAEPPKGDVS